MYFLKISYNPSNEHAINLWEILGEFKRTFATYLYRVHVDLESLGSSRNIHFNSISLAFPPVLKLSSHNQNLDFPFIYWLNLIITPSTHLKSYSPPLKTSIWPLKISDFTRRNFLQLVPFVGGHVTFRGKGGGKSKSFNSFVWAPTPKRTLKKGGYQEASLQSLPC